MKGEFRGDFSRDTFDPSKHFMRVLMQQGRVSLDADWNEQTDILLHYMQTLARDLIGPFAGPEEAGERGFNIAPSSKSTKSFSISTGRYYVDGILCENELISDACKKIDNVWLEYNNQPDFPLASDSDYFLFEKEKDFPLLAYLDVWERHISYVEDDDIREKALGVADTASRSKVVWQVKALKSSDKVDWKRYVNIVDGQSFCDVIRQNWNQIVKNVLQNPNRGCLKAQAKDTDEVSTEPCITSPESSYRGEENQLYRVEIHSGFVNGSEKSVTFKWSRDNGTVAFPIISKKGNVVMLEHMGRDNRLSLKKDDWVEVVDDEYTLLIQSRPSPLTEAETRPLAQVDAVDTTERTVTLRLQDSSKIPDYPENGPDRHPMLRRWDHKKGNSTQNDEPKLAADGAFLVEENKWLNLEDGIQIWFQNSSTAPNPVQVQYQTGDYWLVPARTATGDVEWPEDAQDPDGKRLLPPHGIDHHYAPLAYIDIKTDGSWAQPTDCRCVIKKALNPPCDKKLDS